MSTLWTLCIQMRNLTQSRRRQPLPEPPQTTSLEGASTFSCPLPHTKHRGSSICPHLLNSNSCVLVVQDKVFLLMSYVVRTSPFVLLHQLLSLISSEMASPTSCVFCFLPTLFYQDLYRTSSELKKI